MTFPRPKGSLGIISEGIKPPKDKMFVMLLLGVTNADGSEPLNPIQVLKDLGWTLESLPAPANVLIRGEDY